MPLLLASYPGCAALAALLVCGAACALVYLIRIVPVGLAYKAKILCSALFVSGRKFEAILAQDVSVDSYRIMRLFRAKVDAKNKSVTVTLLGLRSRTAVFRPGLGVTLALGQSPEELRPLSIAVNPAGSGHWRVRRDSRLDPVVESAFTEPDPDRLRRTRAILIVREGKIVAEKYAPGFSENTRLCGWSMSKSVLGSLTGILVGNGKLALERKKLLPGWSSPGDPRGEISLEDLLRMRSGLDFGEVYSDPLEDVTQMLFARGDAAAFAAEKSLVHPPGSTWYYSSGTTNILSHILRRAHDRDEDYWDFPRKTLFDPLGMTSALVEPGAAGDFLFSSFVYATARDWARFGQFHLQDGVWDGNRILPEGWRDFCVEATPQSAGGQYGAHWWLKLQEVMGGGTEAAARIPPDAYFAIGHEGQVLTVVPSERLVVVRLGLAVYIDAWNHAEFMQDVLEAL